MILDPKALQAKIKQDINQLPVLVDVKFIEQGVEIPGQVYVKKISYTHADELEKAYTWKPHEEDESLMQLEKINVSRLKAAHIFATICTDEKGTPFFENIEQVFQCGPDMCRAFWDASNSINLFWGKSVTKSSSETKSLQNSQSTESVETASPKSKAESRSGSTLSGEPTETRAEA